MMEDSLFISVISVVSCYRLELFTSVEFAVFYSKKFNFLVHLWFKIIQNIVFVFGAINFALHTSLNRKFFGSGDKVFRFAMRLVPNGAVRCGSQCVWFGTVFRDVKLVGKSHLDGIIRLYF